MGADILLRQGPRPGEWRLHPEVVKQKWSVRPGSGGSVESGDIALSPLVLSDSSSSSRTGCHGWNQDSSGNDDQLIMLHLTPCDPLDNTSNREEVRTTQVEETRNMLVEQMSITEGQVEQVTIMEGQVEQVTIMGGQAEQMSTTVGQVEQATIMEGQAEQISTKVNPMKPMNHTFPVVEWLFLVTQYITVSTEPLLRKTLSAPREKIK
ncbi:uncharacterized protein LOC128318921 [Pangasianodon hypophthalmus]|uniref:uncharacterized protein LOC128318921 n=1 Tax=Pangasianodon hypophthalmus TaxID=310915 RepID=UPI002307CB58|nr:uncharacterized protein LOC128318921 [Pangasianodon hypophthalmus]